MLGTVMCVISSIMNQTWIVLIINKILHYWLYTSKYSDVLIDDGEAETSRESNKTGSNALWKYCGS